MYIQSTQYILYVFAILIHRVTSQPWARLMQGRAPCHDAYMFLANQGTRNMGNLTNLTVAYFPFGSE